eukprot:2700493-Amphidinium_carterae.1
MTGMDQQKYALTSNTGTCQSWIETTLAWFSNGSGKARSLTNSFKWQSIKHTARTPHSHANVPVTVRQHQVPLCRCSALCSA